MLQQGQSHRPRDNGRNKAMKLKKEHKLARKRLAPLIALCASERGARSELQRRLKRIMGREVAWHQVAKWVAKNADDWKNPSFATGCALLEAQKQMCVKMEATAQEELEESP